MFHDFYTTKLHTLLMSFALGKVKYYIIPPKFQTYLWLANGLLAYMLVFIPRFRKTEMMETCQWTRLKLKSVKKIHKPESKE